MGPQRQLEQQLASLKAMLVRMAGLAEDAVRVSVQSLYERDSEMAGRVIEGDRAIDDLEIEVNDAAIHVLGLQQPMAGDLRFVTMALKIAKDLERVGDHAVNIAQGAQRLMKPHSLKPLPEIEEMVRVTLGMLNDALDSFMSRDSALAREIVIRDDRVDGLHTNVFRILLTHMMEDPRRIGPGLDVLSVSRNLERIADLATNVAEDVVYLVEGRTIMHHAEERRIAAAGS
jgi:phosphate transport system protein